MVLNGTFLNKLWALHKFEIIEKAQSLVTGGKALYLSYLSYEPKPKYLVGTLLGRVYIIALSYFQVSKLVHQLHLDKDDTSIHLKAPKMETELAEAKKKYDFLRFTFIDIHGIGRSKTVSKSSFDKFFKNGAQFGVGRYTGIVVLGNIGQVSILLDNTALHINNRSFVPANRY